MTDTSTNIELLNSINDCFQSGIVRDLSEIKAEAKEDFKKIAYTNYEAAELEIEGLFKIVNTNIETILMIHARRIQEIMTENKMKAAALLLEYEKARADYTAYLNKGKRELSIVDENKARVSKEESIAKQKNVDYGLLISHLKTTAGYLGYVLVVDPEQLTNTAGTSPLTRFKNSKAKIISIVSALGYGNPGGSTILDTITASLGIISDTTEIPTTATLNPFVADNDYNIIIDTIVQTLIELHTDMDIRLKDMVNLPQVVADEYFNSFAMNNEQRAKLNKKIYSLKYQTEAKIEKAILDGRQKLYESSVDKENDAEYLAVKFWALKEELRKLYQDVLAVRAKIGAAVQDLYANVARIQNFYDNLLRQATDVLGSYANSVVSAVPENAQTVVDDFKDILDKMEAEINARL